MSKEEYYIQCKLQKDNQFQYSWLPEKVVKNTETVDLKEEEDWNRGWKIVEKGAMKPKSVIEEIQRNQKGHRKATDI